MAIYYHFVPRKDKNNPDGPVKYYPSLITKGRVTTREMAEEGADGSTLTPTDVFATKEMFLRRIPRILLQSKIVDLGDFGCFRITLRGKLVSSKTRLGPQDIKKIKVHFIPGKAFAEAFTQIEFIKEVNPPRRKHK